MFQTKFVSTVRVHVLFVSHTVPYLGILLPLYLLSTLLSLSLYVLLWITTVQTVYYKVTGYGVNPDLG